MNKIAISLLIALIPAIVYMYFYPSSWFISILLLLAGGFVLIEGSNIFVEGAAALASHIGASEHAIGLTIVAFGTSLPEFAVSFTASLEKHSGISLGNVLGSNVANILLILGFSMLLMPLRPSKFSLKDSIYLLFFTIIVIILGIDGSIKFYDGFILLILYAIFIYLLYRRKGLEAACKSSLSLPLAILMLISGGVSVGIGGKAVIKAAVEISRMAGVSEAAIAASIVAFGTSLPEFMTSVMATIKNYHGIAVGNVIGSNIVNIGIVLGSSGIAGSISFSFGIMEMFFILSAILATLLIKFHVYGKISGIVFLLIYLIFIIFLYL